MKVDLHCNLPYDSTISNPALSYLKGYLSMENDIAVRNIYWNILPLYLHNRYQKLKKKTSKFFPSNSDIFICLHIARYLYHNNLKQLQHSPLKSIFESPFFLNLEMEDLVQDLKSHIDNYIWKKKLFDAEVVGFSMGTYQWILNYYVLLQLKKHNPNIKTVVGGINSIGQGLEFMRVFKKADFAIWGEGEIPFLMLLRNIENPSSFKKIPNLIYRKKDEILPTFEITTEELPDINQYPFADHTDYFNTLNEHQFNIINTSESSIPIWGTRSCWWNKCKFCVLYKGGYFRERSPENIVAEIEYQSKKHDTDNFLFVDADAGRKDRKSFDKLLKVLIQSSEQRTKPYKIFSMMSPLRLDRKSFETMSKIIFESIQIGFEAMTDSLLRKMMKKQSLAYNIQTLKLAEEQKFPLTNLNIIRGIPSETQEDVIESINNLKFLRFYLNEYNLQLSELVLFKGSPFYSELSNREIKEAWNKSYEWLEVKDLDLFSSADKYEFFGFVRKNLVNSSLWNIFGICLKLYQSDGFRYNWFEYSDGSSLIKEGEKGYIINPTETEILIFCDTVKTFTEIRNHFPKLKKNELQEILLILRSEGLLYFRNDFKSFFISVISTKYKK